MGDSDLLDNLDALARESGATTGTTEYKRKGECEETAKS